MSQSQGALYLVPTPIGNLEDITLRALRVLRESDLIAAEDTRHSRGLLSHFDIHTPLTAYHEFTDPEKEEALISRLKAGAQVALITDAGTPGISDPGERLVRRCFEEGIFVTCLPGASAAISALAASGQPSGRFVFEGFLPRENKERAQRLAGLETETRTMILYEAPHRLKKTLSVLAERLGEGRLVTVCRELTKIHEERWVGTLGEAARRFETQPPRGEFVLVIAGRPEAEAERERHEGWEAVSIEDHVRQYQNQGLSKNEAMRRAAKDRGISRRDVYQALLACEQEDNL